MADPIILDPNWVVSNKLASPKDTSFLDTSCKCSGSQVSGKKLVVCIDGTSNKYGDKNTNIVELYSEMAKDTEQLTYYNSGVGTYAKGYTHWTKQVSSIFDLAFAFTISRTIMDAYRWLSDNYQPGDKIFLFGFSRGAYQVRALAGMIHEVGLILPGNQEQIPYAFDLYSAINSGKSKDKSLAAGFRSTFSRQRVVVHFVGVWDTVSSVGFRKQKILPSTDTCDHICYFRQALALDERRVKFLPEYVHGGASARPKPQLVPPHPEEDHVKDHVKEVWFAGTHSDVGGGKREKTDNALSFNDMPLLWMREEALDAGLSLHSPKIAFKYEDLKALKTNDTLTLPWRLLELLPIRRLCYNNSNQHTSLPHVGKGRIILPGQKVHASVRFRTNYRSKASFWRNLQQWPEAIDFYNEQEQSWSQQAWESPFKRSTAEVLVGTIHKKHMLDYVDRLAFMCSFKPGLKAVRKMNPLRTLEAILDIHGTSTADIEFAPEDEVISPSADPNKETIQNDTPETRDQVRLNAFVAYCRIVEKDKITERMLDSVKVPIMLKHRDPMHQRRACAALPTLCEIPTLRNKLLNEDLIHRIVELYRTAGENQLIAMKTLSYLAQRFDEIPLILSQQPDFIEEIIISLEDTYKSSPLHPLFFLTCISAPAVIVAALKILAAMTSKGNIQLSEDRQTKVVRGLKKLIKRRDFFVTPAAVAALCEICTDEQIRKKAIDNDILTTLIDLLEFDKSSLSGGPRGLKKLAIHEDVRKELAQGPHIGKLVAFSRDKVVEKSNEATEELTMLSEYHELRKKIIDEGGLDSIVNNLAKPDHALFAADALLTFMKYDDAKVRILDVERSKVDQHLLQMIEERIFDGTIGREGIDILEEICKNDDLRDMMLHPKNPSSRHNDSRNFGGKDAPQQLLEKAANYTREKTMHRLVAKQAREPEYPRNIIGTLHKMIETTRLGSVQNSAISYLRIIVNYKNVRQEMTGVGIIKPLLWCLTAIDVDIRALEDVLEEIAHHESLRDEIMKNHRIVAEMLSSHCPVEILRMTSTFIALSSYDEIWHTVRKMVEYQNLKKDTLHYLDPHRHPHEHDLYTSAYKAIESIIDAFDKPQNASSHRQTPRAPRHYRVLTEASRHRVRVRR